MSEAEARIVAWKEKHAVSFEREYVPPRLREADKREGLAWRVSFCIHGKARFTFDYFAGIGHCPSYPKRPHKGFTLDEKAALDFEVETGKRCERYSPTFGARMGEPIVPKACDLLYALAMDSDALTHASFELWAEAFGYDGDSRKAERIYQACLANACALLSAVGMPALHELIEACKDY